MAEEIITKYYERLPTVEVLKHDEDERGNIFTLRKQLICRGLEIPAGFESDGASVPRFFWSIVFPPDDDRALYAAIVHDFVYRTHPYGWTRKDADEAFREFLIRGGVPESRARRAYWGVRLFGGWAWDEGGKA